MNQKAITAAQFILLPVIELIDLAAKRLTYESHFTMIDRPSL